MVMVMVMVVMRMMLGWDDGSYGKFQGRRKQAATENSAVTRMRIKHKSTEDHRNRREDDRIRG